MKLYPDFDKEYPLTIEYQEWSKSPEDGFDEHGHFWGRRILRCEWKDRIQLMQELTGGNWSAEEGPNVWLGPSKYPWYLTARVTKVSASPYPEGPKGHDITIADGGISVPANHDYAFLTVDYAVIPKYKWSFSTEGEFVTKVTKNTKKNPVLWWYAANDFLTGPESPSVLYPTGKAELEIYTVRRLPEEVEGIFQLTAWAGYVNNDVIDPAYLPPYHPGFAAGTFRYDGAEFAHTTTTLSPNREPWSMKLNFSVRSGGWNKFYPPAKTTPEYVYTHATERGEAHVYLPYPPGDFDVLLESVLGG